MGDIADALNDDIEASLLAVLNGDVLPEECGFESDEELRAALRAKTEFDAIRRTLHERRKVASSRKAKKKKK